MFNAEKSRSSHGLRKEHVQRLRRVAGSQTGQHCRAERRDRAGGGDGRTRSITQQLHRDQGPKG